MSRRVYLFVMNGALLLNFLGWLILPANQTEAVDLPGVATPSLPPTHLAMVTYPQEKSQQAVTVGKALNERGRANIGSATQAIETTTIPSHCQLASTHAAPNGRYLIWQFNCEASLFIHVEDLQNSTEIPISQARGYFLDWSPDSKWFLFRDIEADQVQLVSVTGAATQTLTLPSGSYNATFAPDGSTVLFAANEGLGFGSTLGQLNLAKQEITWQRQFPHRIVAFPEWSPDGSRMAYILMPDSNVPFTLGQLWLADVQGKPTNLLDVQADAGRGYAPMWSPDGQTIAFVRRENVESASADYVPAALHSNIYLADVATFKQAGESMQSGTTVGYGPTPDATEPVPVVSASSLTSFNETHVYDLAWSPDGTHLAFTAGDAVWLLSPGQEPWRVSTPGVFAKNPAWVATQNGSE